MLRAAAKILFLVGVVVFYTLTGLIIVALTRNPFIRRRRLSRNIHRWARLCLRIFNIQIERLQPLPTEVFKRKNFLVVCNHVSYTDVIILAACFPSVFVTSVEVRESGFVGWMSTLGGCVFVERRKREKIGNEIDEITQALLDGLNVVIFPEATSTNGETVLPFKRALLKSALDAKVDVLPLAICYAEVNGQPLTPVERERICYYGEKDFFPHLIQTLSLGSIKVFVRFMPEIPVEQIPDRKVIADQAYTSIHDAYQNMIAPSSSMYFN